MSCSRFDCCVAPQFAAVLVVVMLMCDVHCLCIARIAFDDDVVARRSFLIDVIVGVVLLIVCGLPGCLVACCVVMRAMILLCCAGCGRWLSLFMCDSSCDDMFSVLRVMPCCHICVVLRWCCYCWLRDDCAMLRDVMPGCASLRCVMFVCSVFAMPCLLLLPGGLVGDVAMLAMCPITVVCLCCGVLDCGAAFADVRGCDLRRCARSCFCMGLIVVDGCRYGLLLFCIVLL